MTLGEGASLSQQYGRSLENLTVKNGGTFTSANPIVFESPWESVFLSGRGTIQADLEIINSYYGEIRPGDGRGTLTIDGDVSFKDSYQVVYQWEYDAGGNTDLIEITGALTVQEDFEIKLIGRNGAALPENITLFTFGELIGEDDLARWTITGWDRLGDPSVVVSGNSLIVTPEPATMMLLAVGGLALLRRKRNARR